MSSILIKNGLIITMDGQKRVIENGSVYIENNKITRLGKSETVNKEGGKAERVIDAKGRIILPGFFTAHSHLYGMLLKSIPLSKLPPTLVPSTDFTQILQGFWWPCDESLDEDSVYACALAGAMEYVKMGVTCFAETLSSPNVIDHGLDYQEKACDEVGIRGLMGFETTERRGATDGQKGIAENKRFIEKTKAPSKRIKGIVGLHASFTLSDEAMTRSKELADRNGVPVHMHCCEGLGDVYHNYERYGLRPVERLKKIGFLGSNVCLAHCIQMTRDPDLMILKETDTRVAHDPMPNMFEGAGLAPLHDMLNEGLTVGLGDDAYVLDPFQNMRFAMSAHAGSKRDPRIINPELMLQLYTNGSAKCFGMDGKIGSLQEGKLADLIIVEPHVKTIPLSSSNIMDYVVNFIDGDDVKTTIIDGRVVMENGKMTTIDEAKASEKCRKEALRLWDKLSSSSQKIAFLT